MQGPWVCKLLVQLRSPQLWRSPASEQTQDQNQVGTQRSSPAEIFAFEIEEKPKKEENCCIQVTFAYDNEISTVMPIQTVAEEEESPLIEQNVDELQENCPDFQQIYKYLKDGFFPVETTAAEMVMAESKHFSLVDGILYHWFQRQCKKPKGEFNLV